MKNVFTLIVACFICSLAVAQTEIPQPVKAVGLADTPALIKDAVEEKKSDAKMEFETKTVDFGTIDKDSDPFRSIMFTNTGTEPLVILNARGSCGCTVPTYSKEPIMPGEESEIKIRYATNRLGKINKTVRITTNEGGDPHVLKVVGMVNDVKQEEAVPKAEPNILGGN